MTRRGTTVVVAAILVCVFAVTGTAAAQGNKPCTTIQDGTLKAPIDATLVDWLNQTLEDEYGNPLRIVDTDRAMSVGYDEYGYNYQARNFAGFYKNWNRPDRLEWISWQWGDDQLSMTWNDAWLSNKDCDKDVARDGKLDRPLSYEGSGAVVVIHMGGMCTENRFNQWTRQVVISAVPSGALPASDGTWSYKGKTLGSQIEITFLDTRDDIPTPTLATGLALTKDSINTSCPTEGDHGTRFAIPLAPYESVFAVQIRNQPVVIQ